MSDNPNLNIFLNKDKLAAHLAADLINRIRGLSQKKEYVYIALSGGSTPNILFQNIAASSSALDWSRVKFFWVDERCVPPDHSDSNYGSAKPVLIDPLGLSDESVYRIKGENDPDSEAKSYGEIIQSIVTPELNSTVFDIILLGMGEDGHTASIFPHQINLWDKDELCVVGVQPVTGQKRVSFAGQLINAADSIIFMVTGESKAHVLSSVINKSNNYKMYPASLVSPVNGRLEWFIDQDAASLLKKH